MQVEVQVTEEMIRHSRIQDLIYFGGLVYSAAVLLLATRMSGRLQAIARRPLLFVALLIVVLAALHLPLTYYVTYVVPHQFDLSNQSFGEWFSDGLKGLAIAVVIGSPLGALALYAIRKVRRWWLAIWLGSIPVMVLLVVIAPVFLDPLFNRFEPLRNEALRRDLLTLASKAGIEGGRVYEVDKSKQTKTMNAYVTGIGPTKRIVMWDTLLQKMTREEVLAVMGHEMGHYVLNHLWKGLAAAIVIALVTLFIAQRVFDRVSSPSDPAALPWVMLIGLVLLFLLAPVTNGISRLYEHEADRFGLELTGLNHAAATSFVKLAEDSKRNPDPHPFIEFWRYTHPSLRKRIDFALQWSAGASPAR